MPDGQSAIAACQDHPPNLIMIDTGIQDMKAIDLFQNSVYGKNYPSCTRSCSSYKANHSHSDRMAALEAGVDDYIHKPFDIQELLLRVRNNLPQSDAIGRYDYGVARDGWLWKMKSDID